MKCFHCNKPASLFCSKCKVAIYCDRACQIAHRPEHRSLCVEPAMATGMFVDRIAMSLTAFAARHKIDHIWVDVPVAFESFMKRDRCHFIEISRHLLNEYEDVPEGHLAITVAFAEGVQISCAVAKKGSLSAPEDSIWILLFEF